MFLSLVPTHQAINYLRSLVERYQLSPALVVQLQQLWCAHHFQSVAGISLASSQIDELTMLALVDRDLIEGTDNHYILTGLGQEVTNCLFRFWWEGKAGQHISARGGSRALITMMIFTDGRQLRYGYMVTD